MRLAKIVPADHLDDIWLFLGREGEQLVPSSRVKKVVEGEDKVFIPCPGARGAIVRKHEWGDRGHVCFLRATGGRGRPEERFVLGKRRRCFGQRPGGVPVEDTVNVWDGFEGIRREEE